MNARRKSFLCVLLVIASVSFSACSMSPVRMFQAKVPAPIAKPEKQLEAERRAARLIADRLEEPKELKPVAEGLSQSLGEPKKPITEPDNAKAALIALDELRSAMVALQKQVAQQNVILAKYAGKEIEGTGLSLLGPSTVLIVGALVALGVFCPGAIAFLMFLLRRTKAAAGMVVEQIEQASQASETKEAVAKIKKNLGAAMDHLPAKQGESFRRVIKELKTA